MATCKKCNLYLVLAIFSTVRRTSFNFKQIFLQITQTNFASEHGKFRGEIVSDCWAVAVFCGSTFQPRIV